MPRVLAETEPLVQEENPSQPGLTQNEDDSQYESIEDAAVRRPVMLLRICIVILLLALGLRTGIEIRKWQARSSMSKGLGLQELRHRYTMEGDDNVVRIITRSVETGGRFFEYEETASHTSSGFLLGKPGSQPPHRHLNQNETITVLKGSMEYFLGEEMGQASEGQIVFFPAGLQHTWWVGASGEGETTVLVKMEPAGDWGELVIETLAGFSRDHGSAASTPVFQMVLWAAKQDLEFMFLPTWMRIFSSWVLAPMAQSMGYDPVYKVYSTARKSRPETHTDSSVF